MNDVTLSTTGFDIFHPPHSASISFMFLFISRDKFFKLIRNKQFRRKAFDVIHETSDSIKSRQTFNFLSITDFSPQCGIAGALANLSLGSVISEEQIAYENQHRRANWEAGQIDYLGELTFEASNTES